MAKAKSSLIPDAVTPHVLRHTKAMHLLQSGVNLVYIRDILGHVNITTTELYFPNYNFVKDSFAFLPIRHACSQ